jgi:hypothetical protein
MTKKDGEISRDAVVALLDILTETVSALHDDAKPYRVILSERSASAATALEAKLVEIGSKPWRDDDLTEGQRAAVMAGLALHEVGHIRFSQQYTRALNAQFGTQNITNAIRTLSNLAADCHDELAARRLFPGLSDAIRPVLWWCGDKGMRRFDAYEADEMLTRSIADRVNLAIAAVRYPWQVDWSSPDGQTWMTWWTAWGKRAQSYVRPKDHAAIVQEAIDYVRAFTPTQPPQPPPPPPPRPPKGKGEGPGPGGRPMDDDEPPTEKPDGGGKGEGKGEGGDESDDDDGGGGAEPPDDPLDEDIDDGGDDPSDFDDEDDSDDDSDDDEEGKDPTEEPVVDDPKPNNPKDDSDEPIDITQGSLGQEEDADSSFDDREDSDMDDPCATDKSKDPVSDAVLQSEYEKAQRGTREGLRRRRYVHQSSRWGRQAGGRVVTSHPRKGGRWVSD